MKITFQDINFNVGILVSVLANQVDIINCFHPLKVMVLRKEIIATI
jgi:hypothetical protein